MESLVADIFGEMQIANVRNGLSRLSPSPITQRGKLFGQQNAQGYPGLAFFFLSLFLYFNGLMSWRPDMDQVKRSAFSVRRTQIDMQQMLRGLHP